MSEQPKPCPFCGKEAERTDYFYNSAEFYRCPDRKCSAYPCIATLEQWNKRA